MLPPPVPTVTISNFLPQYQFIKTMVKVKDNELMNDPLSLLPTVAINGSTTAASSLFTNVVSGNPTAAATFYAIGNMPSNVRSYQKRYHQHHHHHHQYQQQQQILNTSGTSTSPVAGAMSPHQALPTVAVGTGTASLHPPLQHFHHHIHHWQQTPTASDQLQQQQSPSQQFVQQHLLSLPTASIPFSYQQQQQQQQQQQPPAIFQFGPHFETHQQRRSRHSSSSMNSTSSTGSSNSCSSGSSSSNSSSASSVVSVSGVGTHTSNSNSAHSGVNHEYQTLLVNGMSNGPKQHSASATTTIVAIPSALCTSAGAAYFGSSPTNSAQHKTALYNYNGGSCVTVLEGGGGSTSSDSSSSSADNIVQFHVNTGTSVFLRFGQTTHLFHGPVTVPMVSTNSTPPVAMPIQVPPGHFVQQIVDETGTLRHVILSPAPVISIPQNQHSFNGAVSGPNPQSFYAANAAAAVSYQATAAATHYLIHQQQQQQTIAAPPPPPPPLPLPSHTQSNVNKNTPNDTTTMTTVKILQDVQSQQHHYQHHQQNQQHHYAPNHQQQSYYFKAEEVAEALSSRKKAAEVEDRVNNNSIRHINGTASCAMKKSNGSNRHDDEDAEDDEEDFVSNSHSEKGYLRRNHLVNGLKRPKYPKEEPEVTARRQQSHPVLSSIGTSDDGEISSSFVDDDDENYDEEEVEEEDDAEENVEAGIDADDEAEYSNRKRANGSLLQNGKLNVCNFHSRESSYGTSSEKSEKNETFAVQNKTHAEEDKTSDAEKTVKLNGDGPNKNVIDDAKKSLLLEVLASVKTPTLTQLNTHCALIHWCIPEKFESAAEKLNIEKKQLEYQILISHTGQYGRYRVIYSGPATSCRIQDLKPNKEYGVCLKAKTADLLGEESVPLVFVTPGCEPERPLPPRLLVSSSNELQLGWDPVNDNGSPIRHYVLECSEATPPKAPVVAAAANSNATITPPFFEILKTEACFCTLSKLEPRTFYRFRVMAVNAYGKSSYSDVVIYRTDSSLPLRPDPPLLVDATFSALHLLWQQCRSPDEQFILQANQSHSSFDFVTIFQGYTNEFICGDLKKYTDYRFRMQTRNEAGVSPWSEVVTYRTLATRPLEPSKPTVCGKANPGNLLLQWEPPLDSGGAPITSYVLEVNSGKSFEPIYTGPETETVCETLQPGTTYQCRVYCVTISGRSNYSETTTFTTDVILPSAPLMLKLNGKIKPTSVAVRWSAPEINGGLPLLTYELQISNTKVASEKSIYYRGKETECTIKGLSAGQTYEILVRVGNRIGLGPWSHPPLLVTTASSVPGAPPAPELSVKSATVVSVKWAEPPTGNGGEPITLYQLEMAVESSLETTAENSTDVCCVYEGAARACSVRNLQPFTDYLFRVAALNVCGRGSLSEPARIRTKASVPAAPVLSHSYRSTSTSVTVHWTEPVSNHGSPVLYYNIELISAAAPTATTTTTTTTSPVHYRTENAQQLDYTVGSLAPSSSYRLRVQAVNEYGPGPFSSIAKFATLPLPPTAPRLEMAAAGHNFVKLKWALTATAVATPAASSTSTTTAEQAVNAAATSSNRKLTFLQYYLEVYNSETESFQCIYQGPNNSFKETKLTENRTYVFRVCAKNDAGFGPYSERLECKTQWAAPIAIKSVNCTDISACSCSLDWSQQPKANSFADPVLYQLLLSLAKSHAFKQIYRGPETRFTITNLDPKTEYCLKIFATRIVKACNDLEINSSHFSTKFETTALSVTGTSSANVNSASRLFSSSISSLSSSSCSSSSSSSSSSLSSSSSSSSTTSSSSASSVGIVTSSLASCLGLTASSVAPSSTPSLPALDHSSHPVTMSAAQTHPTSAALASPLPLSDRHLSSSATTACAPTIANGGNVSGFSSSFSLRSDFDFRYFSGSNGSVNAASPSAHHNHNNHNHHNSQHHHNHHEQQHSIGLGGGSGAVATAAAVLSTFTSMFCSRSLKASVASASAHHHTSWLIMIHDHFRALKIIVADNYQSFMFVSLFMLVSFLFAFLIETYINWR